MKRTDWNDDLVESEIRSISDSLGNMPSCKVLRNLGRNDLACQISRRGGFIHWANKIGASRVQSDSDTGWAGEFAVKAWLEERGFIVSKPTGVKCPYDLLINGCVRVDVKTASYAEYGVAKGWFYRIGKHVQADVVMLWQADEGNCYIIPWHVAPTTNITITPTCGKYSGYLNRIHLLQIITNARMAEVAMLAA